jgi:hypothetical protein
LRLLASSDDLVDFLLELAIFESPNSAVRGFAQSQLAAVAGPNQALNQLAQAQGVVLAVGITAAVDKAVESYVLQSAGTPQFESRFLGTLINLEQIRIYEVDQLVSSHNAALKGAVAAQTAADLTTMQAAQTLLAQLKSGTMGSGSGSGS